MTGDMTKGSLAKTLVRFSLPLVLSGLLQQLYNWADALIVGNIEGELSLAAIGATGSVSGLVIMLISGFVVGTSVLAAQMYGEGRREELKNILSTFTIILTGAFLVLSVFGILFTDATLRLLRTPADIFEVAGGYLKIIFAGIPFLVVYNVYSAVLRGMGDSRTPFLAVVVSSFANIALDLLFVAALHYGAAGAAVATVLSQGLMVLFIVCYSIRKYPGMRFSFGKGMVDKRILRSGLALSLPTAIQSSIHSFGNLLLQNFMNGFGTATVAAVTTAYRVDSVIMLPIINLGSGITTVVAQNTGAGNSRRARRGLYVGAVITGIVAAALTLVVIPTSGSLVALFGVTREAVDIGQNFFSIIALFYLPFGIATAIKGYLEGVGDVMFSGVASVVSLLIRIGLSYGLASRYGNSVIASAEAVSWVALLLMCTGRFLWKRRRPENPQTEQA